MHLINVTMNNLPVHFFDLVILKSQHKRKDQLLPFHCNIRTCFGLKYGQTDRQKDVRYEFAYENM